MAIFRCPRCSEPHETILACPYVKAVEFSDGFSFGSEGPALISRVEFLTPRDYGPATGGEKSPDASAQETAYQTLGGPADRPRESAGAENKDRSGP